MHPRGGRGGGGHYWRGRARGTGAGAPIRTDVAGAEPNYAAARRARSESSDEGSSRCVWSSPVQSATALGQLIRSLDGANYGALKRLTGQHFHLHDDATVAPATIAFLRIQPDPFAPGTQLCLTTTVPLTQSDVDALIRTPPPAQGLPDDVARPTALIAVQDYVLRAFASKVKDLHEHAVDVAPVSPHVLQRDAVVVVVPGRPTETTETTEMTEMTETTSSHPSECPLEVRLYFRAKLPGPGRRIDGRGLARILQHSLLAAAQHLAQLPVPALLQHTASVLDQEWLRCQLAPAGLVAFVRDGAILPRLDGIDDAPMSADEAVCFQSPPSLAKTFALPYTRQTLPGMGLPVGLTLIAGGGYHGKSTMLRALELGVYNHIPGDGREFVVVDPTAVKIRAEDRRSVDGVDVSPFINRLPSGKDTTTFGTTSASGSTSQAAAIVEALELDCHTLLLDEDTSATNFMFRDALMAALVPSALEPITPFAARVRELVDCHACAVVMVVGGSGQYFALADTVLVMQSYRVMDKTADAKGIATAAGQLAAPLTEASEHSAAPAFHFPAQRGLDHAASFAAFRSSGGAHDRAKIGASGLHRVRLSADAWLDLSLVEQLVEEGQTHALAQGIAMLHDLQNAERMQAWLQQHRASAALGPARRPLSVFAQHVYACHASLRAQGLHAQTASCHVARGFSAMPRVLELGAALNRMRGLRTGPL